MSDIKDNSYATCGKLTSNDEVSQEQPTGYQRFFRGAGRFLHDVNIWRIKTKCGGRQAVGDQVDPQQLNRD